MVFPGVYLTGRGADSWSIVSHDNKQIFSYESQIIARVYDFNMRKTLPIRTYLVLTLDNEHTPISQDTVNLFCGFNVKFQNRFVIFTAGSVAARIVSAMILKRLVNSMCRASR